MNAVITSPEENRVSPLAETVPRRTWRRPSAEYRGQCGLPATALAHLSDDLLLVLYWDEHARAWLSHNPEESLPEALSRIAPGDVPRRVSFGNSGAEAVEGAIKLARYATGRDKIIAFFGSFHGRTMGALSLTSRKAVQRAGFGPLIPGVVHAPYPYCYRCPYGQEPETCAAECVKPAASLSRNPCSAHAAAVESMNVFISAETLPM